VDFDFVTLAIQPMFLFSATFFPLSTYPEALQWVVRCTPLYHGVALERALVLGDVGWGVLGHVLYLAALGTVGVVGAARRLETLLLS
jgi:lipooligosaccharide transport system permease protein